MQSLLPLKNGYRRKEDCGRHPLTTAVIEKLLKIFTPRNVAFVMFICVYTVIILFLHGGFPLDDSSVRSHKSQVRIRNIHQDYDVGCNGYSMDYRIAEQQRILRSVRSELIECSAKLQEVNNVYEELTKKIPEKQLELNTVLEEIESARRTLTELRDRRNVRVFLPHKPIYFEESPPPPTVHAPSAGPTLETVIDFSRCSITQSMPMYISNLTELSNAMLGFKRELESQGSVVEKPDDACISVFLTNSLSNFPSKSNRNTVVVNFGEPSVLRDSSSIIVQQFDGSLARHFDFNLFLDVPPYSISSWTDLPNLLPYSRKYLLFVVLTSESAKIYASLKNDLTRLNASSMSSGDTMKLLDCSSQSDSASCTNKEELEGIMRSSTFCILLSQKNYTRFFWESLRAGCIPVVPSLDVALPFQDQIDWRLASIRIPLARFPELHFIIRSLEMAEVLELRRMGRFFFEKYLMDQKVVVKALLASLREKLGIPPPPEDVAKAEPLFNNSFVAPILTPVNVPPTDDEYLGPLEGAVNSGSFLHNFTSFNMYSYVSWNAIGRPGKSLEFFAHSADPPTESEFYPDSSIGFRPIEPGSGVEFSKALGGNRAREQFTVVLLTYNRDAVLAASLERLHRLPYLNKVIVIWNNVDREPLGAWPRLHVPVEFIKVARNSLNNRFVPWDRITTEAVLSLDDDIDLKQHEIVFAFRVWRENRHRIVGFPARYHARYGDEMYYNSNHTCQLSIILTGAAFLHKSYLHAYTDDMPEAIRRHVDEVTNCEDIAMNFLVSHITREPPIKTTSKWTLRCPTCTETLSQDESHFRERHECIRLFTRIYGYNPLKFSQFRADSVLFKTRLPPDKQKCFRFV